MRSRAASRSLTPEARLELARSLEERQRHDDALLAYYRAIIESQRQGRWLEQGDDTARSSSAASTHAMRYVKAGRRRVFGMALEPVVARHGREALARFEECLAIQVGERRAQLAGPAPAAVDAVLSRACPPRPTSTESDFPWFEALERETDAIREELLGRDAARGAQRARLRRATRPSGADSRATAARLAGTASTSTATASGATTTTRSARARRRSSRRLPLVRIREHAPGSDVLGADAGHAHPAAPRRHQHARRLPPAAGRSGGLRAGGRRRAARLARGRSGRLRRHLRARGLEPRHRARASC